MPDESKHGALFAVATTAAACLLAAAADCRAAEPSFSCRRASNVAERLICSDDKLAALDRKLAEVYGTATKTPSRYTDLNAGQRRFTQARNDCWEASDFRGCIEELYVRRIAELQAKYRLVAARGPFRYVCGGDPADEVKASFFATDPPSAIIERAGQSLLAYLTRAEGVARYTVGDVSLRERDGGASLVWGRGEPETSCTVQK